MTRGPQQGTNHMCTPQNPDADEQSWLDLGHTVTKPIRAAEPPSDPYARQDLIRKALDSLRI